MKIIAASTPDIWNIRLEYFDPTEFTVIRPYWINPEGHDKRSLSDDDIRLFVPAIYVEKCLETVHLMEAYNKKMN